MDGLGMKGAFMFEYVEDKEYLSRVRSVCGEIMQDFCHTLKEDYDIGSTFYLVGSGAKNLIVQNASQPITLKLSAVKILMIAAHSKNVRGKPLIKPYI